MNDAQRHKRRAKHDLIAHYGFVLGWEWIDVYNGRYMREAREILRLLNGDVSTACELITWSRDYFNGLNLSWSMATSIRYIGEFLKQRVEKEKSKSRWENYAAGTNNQP